MFFIWPKVDWSFIWSFVLQQHKDHDPFNGNWPALVCKMVWTKEVENVTKCPAASVVAVGQQDEQETDVHQRVTGTQTLLEHLQLHHLVWLHHLEDIYYEPLVQNEGVFSDLMINWNVTCDSESSALNELKLRCLNWCDRLLKGGIETYSDRYSMYEPPWSFVCFSPLWLV